MYKCPSLSWELVGGILRAHSNSKSFFYCPEMGQCTTKLWHVQMFRGKMMVYHDGIYSWSSLPFSDKCEYGGFHKWGPPKNGWFIIENPIEKWMMTGGNPMTQEAQQIWFCLRSPNITPLQMGVGVGVLPAENSLW